MAAGVTAVGVLEGIAAIAAIGGSASAIDSNRVTKKAIKAKNNEARRATEAAAVAAAEETRNQRSSVLSSKRQNRASSTLLTLGRELGNPSINRPSLKNLLGQ